MDFSPLKPHNIHNNLEYSCGVHTAFIFSYHSPSLEDTIKYSSQYYDPLVGKGLFEFFFWTWRRRRVECEMWEIAHNIVIFFFFSQGAKHRKTLSVFPRIQWGELTRAAYRPDGHSLSWAHFEALAAIFTLPLSHNSFSCSSLFFSPLNFHQFLSSAKWEAVVIVTAIAWLSLSASLFSCFAPPASPSAFLSFLCVINIYFHAALGGGGKYGKESLSGF